MRDHDQTTTARTAYIVEVDRGDPSWHLHRYEVRSNDAELNELLSEHLTEQEALDAKHRYEDSKLT